MLDAKSTELPFVTRWPEIAGFSGMHAFQALLHARGVEMGLDRQVLYKAMRKSGARLRSSTFFRICSRTRALS